MDKLRDRIRTCEKADGSDKIYVSGEIEVEREIESRKMDTLYTQGEVKALHHHQRARFESNAGANEAECASNLD
jgi:hypothetical protein